MPMTLRGGRAINGTCGRAVLSLMPTFLCLWPCSLAVPVLAGGYMLFCGSYVQELPKAQLAVVLVLKRLRRRGNS